jgi:voltage-gated potassium channel
VIRKSKEALIAVCTLALGYIIVSALIVFNVEGDSFDTFFEAIYWATVSLTTVGYGDIYPVTTAGRIITMISSIFGIAIVALPAGIITAGYMDELSEEKKEEKNEEKNKNE